MKTLYLIRHAKSSWSNPDLRDHDRPLNKRGERDKRVMAKFIHSHFSSIETLYSSTATRALDYAVCINKVTKVRLELDEALYTFVAPELLRFIIKLPNELNHVAIIGHNPAMTEVVNKLSDIDPHKKMANMPTAAVAVLGFDTDSWASLRDLQGEWLDFVRPKVIQGLDE